MRSNLARKVFSGFVLSAILMGPFPIRAEDAVGDWGGIVANTLRLEVHITKLQGHLAAVVDSPDRPGASHAADQVVATPERLNFSIPSLEAKYEAHWDPKTKSWIGIWSQDGQEVPFEIQRLGPDGMDGILPKRPQEEGIAHEALPYLQQNVTFENISAKVQLAGTFSFPQGKGPFPAVVLVGGSGPGTRDEEVYFHKIFLVLADHLNRLGIATLRYDKRGNGGSGGDYMKATTEDFASDAEAALQVLKSSKEVNPKRIGMIGHSEGGLIAPEVAIRDSSVAFLVLMAAPGVSGDKLIAAQSTLAALDSGLPAAEVEKSRVLEEKLLSAIKSAVDPADAKKRAKAILDDAVSQKILDQNEVEAKLESATTPWFIYFLKDDPILTLEKVRVPVLVLNGELDVQVPAKLDLPPIQKALKNDKDVTVLTLSGLNHLFQDAKTGYFSEYGNIEETLSPLALHTIGDWIVKHTNE